MQELGRAAVECAVHDVDDLHAELMEIDENLARAELSPAQEAAHILRRQAIWSEIRRPVGETICSTQKASEHKDSMTRSCRHS
jgi:ParB-like chromosome segregation protein Spo0J